MSEVLRKRMRGTFMGMDGAHALVAQVSSTNAGVRSRTRSFVVAPEIQDKVNWLRTGTELMFDADWYVGKSGAIQSITMLTAEINDMRDSFSAPEGTTAEAGAPTDMGTAGVPRRSVAAVDCILTGGTDQ